MSQFKQIRRYERKFRAFIICILFFSIIDFGQKDMASTINYQTGLKKLLVSPAQISAVYFVRSLADLQPQSIYIGMNDVIVQPLLTDPAAEKGQCYLLRGRS